MAPQTAAPRRTTGDWTDWPAGWPPPGDRRWGRALPARYPRPPRDGELARASYDRGTLRRELAAELRAAIVELDRVDVPWVRHGQHDPAWHRAVLALDRAVSRARHEIMVAADLADDALDWADDRLPGLDELLARPSAEPDVENLRKLLAAEQLLQRRRDEQLAPITRELERVARRAGRRRAHDAGPHS
ncbi:hypothetical protein [Candidatus Solirubrobacter pratensis]|uniref:hypothetical protein n=1 Tax=Candidatus Solirubrobacter pratensis TaxID=1298857 RepID=UPI0012DE9317|nr:hypothetical protein [Candidatus Solirubrobacter pratensis]